MLVEAAALALLTREFRKSQAVTFAFVANMASLVVGGLLLALLPV